MIVLRDVRGLDTAQEEAAMRWAARALVEAMISEAGSARWSARGVDRLGVDAVVSDRVAHGLGLHVARCGERGEHRHDDVGRVDLEVAAKRLAGVGPAEPVGAERDERSSDEPRDLLGHDLHEVGDRDDRPLGICEQPADERRARRLRRVQPVPALGRRAPPRAAPCTRSPTTARRRRPTARPARSPRRAPRRWPSPRTAPWPAAAGPSGASAHL